MSFSTDDEDSSKHSKKKFVIWNAKKMQKLEDDIDREKARDMIRGMG
jgi:hypothetical protein